MISLCGLPGAAKIDAVMASELVIAAAEHRLCSSRWQLLQPVAKKAVEVAGAGSNLSICGGPAAAACSAAILAWIVQSAPCSWQLSIITCGLVVSARSIVVHCSRVLLACLLGEG